jgi:hypothetical protein
MTTLFRIRVAAAGAFKDAFFYGITNKADLPGHAKAILGQYQDREVGEKLKAALAAHPNVQDWRVKSLEQFATSADAQAKKTQLIREHANDNLLLNSLHRVGVGMQEDDAA